MKKSVKHLFNILPPTDENVRVLKTFMNPRSTPELYLASPLARIQLVWRDLGHSGVSIFTFSGISGQSPRMVRRYLEERGTEPMLSQLSYCGNTRLPVYALDYSGVGRGERALYYTAVGRKVEKSLVTHFSGSNWKSYANRSFHAPGRRGTLYKENWATLWEAYWLREAPTKVGVVPREASKALQERWKTLGKIKGIGIL
jgi:hypothetical protein